MYLTDEPLQQNFSYFRPQPLSVGEVLALWRIGHKYMVTDLREEAVSRIFKTYPTTLNDWDKIHYDEEEPISNGLDSDALGVLADLWRLARVSHEGHLYSALPAIYLECACFDTGGLLGASWIDFTEPLSKDIVKVVITGKEELKRFNRDMVFSWFGKKHVAPVGCKRFDGCRLARLLLAQDHFTVDTDVQLFGQARWRDSFTKDLCNVCKVEAKRAYDEGSSKYWDNVPVAFGLGSWTELKERMRKEAGLGPV
jgi:hypothetical protein